MTEPGGGGLLGRVLGGERGIADIQRNFRETSDNLVKEMKLLRDEMVRLETAINNLIKAINSR